MCDSGDIERQCYYGVFYPELRPHASIVREARRMSATNNNKTMIAPRRQRKFVAAPRVEVVQQRKCKYPSLNTRDIDATYDDAEDEDVGESPEERMDEEALLLKKYGQENLAAMSQLGLLEMEQATEPSATSAPVVFDEDDFPETFVVLSRKPETEVTHDDWSVVDDDEINSQWSVTSENHTTFLTVAMTSPPGDIPIERMSVPMTMTTIPKHKHGTKASPFESDYADFEGEFLNYKAPGMKGRTLQTNKRYNRRRG